MEPVGGARGGTEFGAATQAQATPGRTAVRAGDPAQRAVRAAPEAKAVLGGGEGDGAIVEAAEVPRQGQGGGPAVARAHQRGGGVRRFGGGGPGRG